MLNMTRSQQLFAEAVRLLPGGVNSPVRASRLWAVTRFLSNGAKAHI